ncbi:SDR family NAD(P)-dependent oxidoreductase [Infirmifilum lucidum]|uniref:SDR family NAD(P)-dependent oxidoreductase n=1 Tax=Infirmifilum lucidum TaxID=2776706 RepID=A0A7L9FHK9_9CREN|nr:SDR family NAD(P)-dependent oxidoreductase [Infirmifilum lucidum]QOJ79207.1 SDR family NAD(P)-dependent oxidoreductase [Infirmifilum lucidum]
MSLHRTALVTGASSGIGEHISRELVKRGYRVIGVARREEKLKALQAELGSSFTYIVKDLAEEDSPSLIAKLVVENFPQLDVLVNNAGFAVFKPVVEHTLREVEEVFLVNAVRPIQLVIALREVLRPGATVVNIITPAAFALSPRLATYSSSKAALHVLSLALEKELEQAGVRVVRVYPGPTASEFFTRAGVRTPRHALKPEKVAERVVDCIEHGCKEVFIPRVLGVLGFFSPINVYRV